jgi:NitT/TauT family transport system permease protein
VTRSLIPTPVWQAVIVFVALAVWQWGWGLHAAAPWMVPDLLDPYFVSKPSEIWSTFLQLGCLRAEDGHYISWTSGEFGRCLARSDNNLWLAIEVTMRNTLLGFLTGVASGILAGLILGRSRRLSLIFNPFVVALNSIPRIALAPIIILAFGIGDASKVVTSWVVVVFLVFFNTYEGTRSVNADHINAARLLGASEWQVTRTVVIPSAMAWVFASLSPAVSFALIGVIVGEFIGAEHGIGRLIIESEARGEAAGMMVAVFILMIVGTLLTALIRRLQAHLLRWQEQHRAEAV